MFVGNNSISILDFVGLILGGFFLFYFSLVSYADKPTSACLDPNTEDACTDVSCCTWDGSLKGGTCIDENDPAICCPDGSVDGVTKVSDVLCQISLGWEGHPTKLPSSKETEYFDEDNDGAPEKKLVSVEYWDDFNYKNKQKKTLSQCGETWKESEVSSKTTTAEHRYTLNRWYEWNYVYWSFESSDVETEEDPQYSSEC